MAEKNVENTPVGNSPVEKTAVQEKPKAKKADKTDVLKKELKETKELRDELALDLEKAEEKLKNERKKHSETRKRVKELEDEIVKASEINESNHAYVLQMEMQLRKAEEALQINASANQNALKSMIRSFETIENVISMGRKAIALELSKNNNKTDKEE